MIPTPLHAKPLPAALHPAFAMTLFMILVLGLPATGLAQDAAAEGSAPAPGPEYHAQVWELSPELRARMTGVSWHQGCPVELDDLRLVEVLHWGMDGLAHEGSLVVHKAVADEVVEIFGDLYATSFPVERMQLIEDYGGDDNASMAANNTSAFNCRNVPGTNTVSRHSWGLAVDVNPLLNPYVRNGVVLPPEGEAWLVRDDVVPGLITAGDSCQVAFTSRGWTWGGDWVNSKDYQHFQRALR